MLKSKKYLYLIQSMKYITSKIFASPFLLFPSLSLIGKISPGSYFFFSNDCYHQGPYESSFFFFLPVIIYIYIFESIYYSLKCLKVHVCNYQHISHFTFHSRTVSPPLPWLPQLLRSPRSVRASPWSPCSQWQCTCSFGDGVVWTGFNWIAYILFLFIFILIKCLNQLIFFE